MMAPEPSEHLKVHPAGHCQQESSLKEINLTKLSTSQNYLSIFPNQAGQITIRYASNDDDDNQQMEIQTISIDPCDVHIISDWLLDTASDMKK